jgi:hypothetical protein
MMATKMGPFLVILGGLMWVFWCYLVVTAVMPAVLRKLTIYPGTSAYVLCIAPLVLGAIVVISRSSGEGE